ncbi:Probable rRNA-processing protein EBP2 homolog [Prunus dulcis]|uniref:Probable rRNA-processing protein EBP2 homolog n=1 Tax=Prunus dulcis TaxID=3755 RepID=A0A4Y1QZG2_PRUDU|nr:Probable rRNA-processing protein EBP2 homolog [Prunus dulcis]
MEEDDLEDVVSEPESEPEYGEEEDVKLTKPSKNIFYTQALEGARRAFEKLQSMGLPFLRLEDYYAKMVKLDSHMEKVKGHLLIEKKIEEAGREGRLGRPRSCSRRFRLRI